MRKVRSFVRTRSLKHTLRVVRIVLTSMIHGYMDGWKLFVLVCMYIGVGGMVFLFVFEKHFFGLIEFSRKIGASAGIGVI